MKLHAVRIVGVISWGITGDIDRLLRRKPISSDVTIIGIVEDT